MDLTKEKSIREVTKCESPPAISPEGLILIRLGDIGVREKESVSGSAEGLLTFKVNGNTDLVEFSDHIP